MGALIFPMFDQSNQKFCNLNLNLSIFLLICPLLSCVSVYCICIRARLNQKIKAEISFYFLNLSFKIQFGLLICLK